MRLCPNVACVLTKTDLYPEWRAHRRARPRPPGAGGHRRASCSRVSSHAALAGACGTSDAELNDESGFPALVSYLRRAASLGQADLLGRRSAVHDVLAVTDQLAAHLRAERAALQRPGDGQELVAELTRPRQRAGGAAERSARWQQTLNDGVTDLNADIDHDLRDRLREITRAGRGGASTPATRPRSGTSSPTGCSSRSRRGRRRNFVWATERARWLAEQVAEHFAEERERLAAGAARPTPPARCGPVRRDDRAEDEP